MTHHFWEKKQVAVHCKIVCHDKETNKNMQFESYDVEVTTERSIEHIRLTERVSLSGWFLDKRLVDLTSSDKKNRTMSPIRWTARDVISRAKSDLSLNQVTKIYSGSTPESWRKVYMISGEGKSGVDSYSDLVIVTLVEIIDDNQFFFFGGGRDNQSW